MKTCSKCHMEKPLTEYYKSARARDGLQTQCMACQLAYAREHRTRRRAGIEPRPRKVKLLVLGGPGTLFPNLSLDNCVELDKDMSKRQER